MFFFSLIGIRLLSQFGDYTPTPNFCSVTPVRDVSFAFLSFQQLGFVVLFNSLHLLFALLYHFFPSMPFFMPTKIFFPFYFHQSSLSISPFVSSFFRSRPIAQTSKHFTAAQGRPLTHLECCRYFLSSVLSALEVCAGFYLKAASICLLKADLPHVIVASNFLFPHFA